MKDNSNTKTELSRRKRLLFHILTTVFTVITGLFIAELFVRMFFPQQEAMRWFKSDKKYGYVLKTNFRQKYSYLGSDFVMEVKTNSSGHRAKEYNLAKDHLKRILMLGDSFVFGHGVNIEDRFDTKLERLLNQSDENHLVINAGVGGWGTLQEITYAKDHFDIFKPDFIVITFCGNDPYDDIKFIARLQDNDKGAFYFPGKRLIKENLHLYRLLYVKYHKLLHRIILRKRLGNDKKLTIDSQSVSVIDYNDWERTFNYIKKFHSDFLAFNPNGVLLLQAANPLNDDIRKKLSTLSNRNTLFYIDLHDDVISLEPQQRVSPHDGHWSPAVHSISSENIFKTILEIDKERGP